MNTLAAPNYKRIYVWEMPVRLFHWVNALCITVLIVTGYLIGHPLTLFRSPEAYQQYWFGTVRFIHFAFAYLFLFNFLMRLYWSFVGNRFANWRTFLPLKKVQRHDLMDVLTVDILQIKEKGKISLGHNMLAGLSYFCLFLVGIFQILTGFGLYAAMSKSWFAGLFAWVVPLFGSDGVTRVWHHGAM